MIIRLRPWSLAIGLALGVAALVNEGVFDRWLLHDGGTSRTSTRGDDGVNSKSGRQLFRSAACL